MDIALFEQVTLHERPHARGGIFRSYDLLDGPAGTQGNFRLQLSVLAGDFVSPRHRHNFDQVRYQLAGAFDFAADGRMDPGSIAYFPEGTRYGPQRSLSETSTTLVLQFGGASGNGYLSEAEFQRGLSELAKQGTFKDGVFTHARPDGGKTNQDAYEAVWEHVNARALTYPPERYSRPVFMHPASFEWVANGSGTTTKVLGVYSECSTKLAFHRIAQDSQLTLEDNSIYFVCSGSGELAGRPWQRWTACHLAAGERFDLHAHESAEVLQIGLPRFPQG